MTTMSRPWIPVLAMLIAGCAVSPGGDDDEAPSPKPGLPHPVVLDGLPDHCFARVDNNVVRLDLATETITATLDAGFGGVDLSSLGLTQNHLVGCSLGAPVEILDLATGMITTVDVPCDGATAIGDKIYVQSITAQSLTEYANLRTLIARHPLRVLPGLFATRLGAGNRRLLASWHSAGEIMSVNLTNGTPQSIPLPGYDGWIFGLFENAKVRLVAGGWVETGINVYDTTSGQPIGRVFDGVAMEGLACSNGK
jgi:hypothetical protein